MKQLDGIFCDSLCSNFPNEWLIEEDKWEIQLGDMFFSFIIIDKIPYTEHNHNQ